MDIDKLQNSRDKQAVKISSLQDKIHSVDDEANRNLNSSDNAVRTLSNEVRFLKSSLEQITEREHRVSRSLLNGESSNAVELLLPFSYSIFVH